MAADALRPSTVRAASARSLSSSALGLAGVVLGLLTWRQGRQASGSAAVAGRTESEPAAGGVRIGRTGAIRMSGTSGTNMANTGAMEDVDLRGEPR